MPTFICSYSPWDYLHTHYMTCHLCPSLLNSGLLPSLDFQTTFDHTAFYTPALAWILTLYIPPLPFCCNLHTFPWIPTPSTLHCSVLFVHSTSPCTAHGSTMPAHLCATPAFCYLCMHLPFHDTHCSCAYPLLPIAHAWFMYLVLYTCTTYLLVLGYCPSTVLAFILYSTALCFHYYVTLPFCTIHTPPCTHSTTSHSQHGLLPTSSTHLYLTHHPALDCTTLQRCIYALHHTTLPFGCYLVCI